ncbi:hypothetical protein BC941DRAFT_436391 [Chlamydoabsidia padenii]|nr:hypothetical protein BC941DRAFT_436391 [Chlamydoabsidia padenii]
MELILGKHNGLVIKGKNPRRPRMRKEEERILLESTIRLNEVLKNKNAARSSSKSLESRTACVQQHPRHVLDIIKNDKWTVEELTPGEYTIILHNFHHLFHFIHTLSRASLDQQAQGIYPMPPAGKANDNLVHPNRKYTVLPYINFHGELYAKPIWKPRIHWSLFDIALPALLDNCIHFLLCCMNHYYPIRPKQVMIKWYSNLSDPSKDPLVLAIGLFWARHVFIHHFPSGLLTAKDNKIVEAVQCRLAAMVREALSDCFDVPHIHHVYALSLCNMTNRIAKEQKAPWHTVAVRMAITLCIRPSEHPTTDQAELESRVWWYLFHVDHFLLESGIIPNSLLTPRSDDHDALLALLRPMPCTVDEPDEAIGALVWSHILKLWLIRRKLVEEIKQTDPREESKMLVLKRKVHITMDQWQSELPSELQLDSSFTGLEGPTIATEACYVISMERCTNMSLLMRYFFPTSPQSTSTLNNININNNNSRVGSFPSCLPENNGSGSVLSLKGWQREALMEVVECSIEFVRIRCTLVKFSPCQTWPGDLKRTVELLISCMQFSDSEVVVRSQLCLMRALRVLRCYEELQWRDDTCMELITQIEQALELVASLKNFHHNLIDNSSLLILDEDMDVSSANYPSNKKKSKNPDNRMDGMMLFDRKLQPRNQYYHPPVSLDSQDQLSRMIVFEDVSKFY